MEVENCRIRKNAYVGMIGSRRHSTFVKEALLEEGISEDLINSIYTPIGLSIEAETPEEIAAAICGELIQVKNKTRRNFGFPREMLKAILFENRNPMILVTIVKRSGSAPRTTGSKMLVREDGSIIGSIGGGSAEGEVIQYASVLLYEGVKGTELRHLNFTDIAEEDGMVCGGDIVRESGSVI